MTLDFTRHLGAVTRSVTDIERDGKPARIGTLSRVYATTPDDLWDAITDPERLSRWFLPVEGDLRLGGRYQLKGNAGGTIEVCDPPRALDLTWEFGGDVSWVEVRLAREGDDTRLTLSHTAFVGDHMDKYGPAATGVGWEGGLIGLDLHFSDPSAKFEEDLLSSSPEGKAFIASSGRAWEAADVAAGTDPEKARMAADATIAFYSGEET